MTCIVIEDQAPAQRILTRYINDIDTLELKGCFTDAISALDFLNTELVDLIFLDIHLPKISGIDFLKTLKNPPKVIITTAFSEYAVQSYEFDVEDYLLKPFSFERFVKAVSKVSAVREKPSEVVNEKKDKVFFIKSGYEYLKVNSDDIYYIKSDLDYTEIHIGTKMHLTSETLAFWVNKLPKNEFIRVHKSYLVHIKKVDKVSSKQIYLESNKLIPLGRAYRDTFLSKFVK